MTNSENKIYLGRYTIDEEGNLRNINGQRSNISEEVRDQKIGLEQKAKRIAGVALTLGGLGLAACRPDSSQEPLSPTTTSGVHIVRVEPEPTISTSEMILKSEPDFITGSAIGKSGRGGESLTGMVVDRQDEIRKIKEIMAQEAGEGNLYPHDVFLALGRETAGYFFTRDEKGEITGGFRVTSDSEVASITTTRVEYLIASGSFEKMPTSGQPGELRKLEGDIYRIEPDTTGLIAKVTKALVREDGQYVFDTQGHYVFDEKTAETAIVLTAVSTNSSEQKVIIIKGDLQPVTRPLEEGVLAEFDPSIMRVAFTDQKGKTLAIYNPFTGEWDGGKKEEVIVIAPEIKGILDLEGFMRVWDKKNERYNYVDVDGKVIAYWDIQGNGGEGRVELAEGVKGLDFKKHRGIFVNWSPEAVEAEFEATQRMALPYLGEQGQILEGVGNLPLLYFENITIGTVVVAPFSGDALGYNKTSSGSENFFLISRKVDFPLRFFGVFGKPISKSVEVGDPVFSVSDGRLKNWGGGLYSSAQIILCIADPNMESGRSLTFADLQRDNLGRIVRVGGPVSK